ncbi:maleylacetoacetate isomerase [Tahibacter soli]|jgi:maleylacetoacetate isomerase|uniref:Maleylacetoacetate isomerase n=1 Tax=Tahibacter soli TaxID=2983605 RepID=A0A9X4BG60_9GAMM|nr:maleylacetoacetate isomerase [Tahibacter soli]MDC8011081.1 maleylacetoacetate isomerase [Tahibacter soli]
MSAEGGLRLYGYWRSSAAYRVRIALNLKGLPYETVPVHLVNNGGEQHAEAYRRLNPQELIPVLQDGGRIVRQSMAIVEYLDEAYEGHCKLLPTPARDRARVRALAQIVACDVHPLNNLRVLQYLEREFNVPPVERERWSRHWIVEGFRAFEELLAENPSTGQFCEGDDPSLADVCLIPQVYNARRWDVDLSPFPTIQRIDEHCRKLPAFADARPEAQPDAPPV